MVHWWKGLLLSLSVRESFGLNENNSHTLIATNNSRYTTSVDIAYFNYQKVLLHIPTMIFLGMLSIAGIIGNVLVLHIYMWKMKPSNHRVFIICLAAIDLTVCITGIPFTIYYHMYPLMLREKWLCKISVLILYAMSFASICILLVIAVERYRKICKPLQRQMSIFQAKVCCAVIVVISVPSTLPVTSIFGLHTVQTGVRGLTGTRCFVDDAYTNTSYFFYISLFTSFAVFIIFDILSILYYFVDQTIRQRNKKMVVCNQQNVKVEGQSMTNNSSTAFNDEQSPIQNNINTSNEENTSHTDEESGVRKIPNRNIQDFRIHRNTAQALSSRRKTIMLFTISVVFFVSFFPHMILQLVASLRKDFVQSLGAIQYCIYDFFTWSVIFINNVANPIIYGVCDKRFISKVRRICHVRVH